MFRIQLTQKGFAAVESILIVVILAIIGGTGYYIYNANNTSSDTLSSAAKTSQNSPPKTTKKKVAVANPAANWTAYTSPAGKFSLKYPNNWVQPSHPESCDQDTLNRTLYLGPNSDSVTKCGSDSFGQVSIESIVGEQTGGFGGEGLTQTAKIDITVDGVQGQRYVERATSEPQALGAYPKDTKVVAYVFSAHGNTYKATYIQTPLGDNPSKDVLADFDLMVTKTLKFQ